MSHNRPKPEEHVQLGRFAPSHVGHAKKARRVKELVGKPPLILLGSTNVFTGKPPTDERERAYMMRTPFTSTQRAEMLRLTVGEELEIIELPDRNPDPKAHRIDSSLWLADIKAIEERRGVRFVFHGGAPEDIAVLSTAFEARVTVDRLTEGGNVSATQVRKHLERGDEAALHGLLHHRVVPLALSYYRENLRVILGQ